MKASGITRRVDELGRIVLPRELRKTYKIDVGSKLEILIGDDKEIILKKVSEMDDDKKEYDKCVRALASIIENDILICDREKVISASSKKYIDKFLSNDCYEIVRKHDTVIKKRSDGAMMIKICDDVTDDYSCELIVPIVRDGDSIGAIIVITTGGKCFNNDNIKISKAFAALLSAID